MRLLILLVMLVIAAAIVVPQTFYSIDETQLGIVTRFGAVEAVRTSPGLYTKTPFIEQIRRFDKRLLRYDAPQAPLLTKDKRTLVVDAYARYRIVDVVLFFKTLNSELNADARVGDIISSELRREVALDDQITVIRDAREDITKRVTEASNRSELPRNEALSLPGGLRDSLLTIILSERSATGEMTGVRRTPTPEELDLLIAQARPPSLSRFEISYTTPLASRLGIEILDVRIKAADFPPDIESSVFARMEAERERIASGLRAEGEQASAQIRADVDRQVTIIVREAQGAAAKLRGEGEGEAIRILAKELERDPDFYVFQRSLEAYSKILASGTTAVLSSESELFRFLEGPSGKGAAPAGK
ncbi:MAG: protease modulator HflC [SAR202 cluster bacterium]|nr:protease modulator HflC [SAR202 cluster bacterium]